MHAVFLKQHESEVYDIMFALYDDETILKNHIAAQRREAEAEGEARGRAEGEARGRAEGEARGRAEGEARGVARGKLEGALLKLAELVRIGLIDLKDAAANAGVSEEEFRRFMSESH